MLKFGLLNVVWGRAEEDEDGGVEGQRGRGGCGKRLCSKQSNALSVPCSHEKLLQILM